MGGGGEKPIPPHHHTTTLFPQHVCGFSIKDDGTAILFLGVSFVEILLPDLGIRNRMFLGLSDPDQIVRSTDPDPAPDPSLFS